MKLKWMLGAAALLLQGCATRSSARGPANGDSLLQRMLVAEDSRGKGAEGILPLLEGARSADTTLRRVALRGLDRVRGYKPLVAAPAARPPREAPKSCASLVPPTHDQNPRAMLAAIDALGGPCTEDGTARAEVLRAIATTLDARDLPRAAGHVSWHAAAHAIVALARVPGGDRPAAELLPRFLAHPRPQVRAYAARAAAALKNEAVLLRLTSDPDHNVVEAAILGLSQLKKHAYDSVYVAALASRGYQVVLTATNALAGSPSDAAIPALLATLDRLTAERRENARDERIALFARVAELGTAPDAPRIRPYLTDFDTTIAGKAAAILTKWTGATVAAHANPLPIRPEPLAEIFRTRGMQLRITMAESSGGGTILARLFTDNAPATVARIVRLARAHYYDGLTFHRIVPGFVIQGGSPDANEQVGDAAFMRDELGGPSHTRGTLGISTRGHDTGDAQIFVNLVDNLRLDHDYTVFGEVVSGMDVVDGILEGDVMARWEIIGGTIPK